MIKAVIFDFFGVICSDDYWRLVSSARSGKNEFRTLSNQVNSGEIHWQDFVKKLAKAANVSIKDVQKIYKDEQIDPRMVDLIADLHNTYKTGLITNAHHEFIDPMLAKTHLLDHLDSVVVSSRVRVVKPHPDIFHRCLEDLGVEPHEAVFIDDLDRHVLAAQAVGMQAFKFDDFVQAKHKLEALLRQD